MKINIYFMNPFKSIEGIYPQAFYYKSYKYVKGFNLRLFGLHFNVRQSNASEKLLEFAKEQLNSKIKHL